MPQRLGNANAATPTSLGAGAREGLLPPIEAGPSRAPGGREVWAVALQDPWKPGIKNLPEHALLPAVRLPKISLR